MARDPGLNPRKRTGPINSATRKEGVKIYSKSLVNSVLNTCACCVRRYTPRVHTCSFMHTDRHHRTRSYTHTQTHTSTYAPLPPMHVHSRHAARALHAGTRSRSDTPPATTDCSFDRSFFVPFIASCFSIAASAASRCNSFGKPNAYSTLALAMASARAASSLSIEPSTCLSASSAGTCTMPRAKDTSPHCNDAISFRPLVTPRICTLAGPLLSASCANMYASVRVFAWSPDPTDQHLLHLHVPLTLLSPRLLLGHATVKQARVQIRLPFPLQVTWPSQNYLIHQDSRSSCSLWGQYSGPATPELPHLKASLHLTNTKAPTRMPAFTLHTRD